MVLIMGVSGSGKSTIGRMLAKRAGWGFVDADMLHPPENIRKMQAGIPLSDDDRWPWLRDVAKWIEERHKAGEPGIVACSALRRAYRELLRSADPGLRIVYLEGDREQLVRRLKRRFGHFFPSILLDSQLHTLEPPDSSEGAITVHIGRTPAETVELVLAAVR